jgi:hypothetical protein
LGVTSTTQFERTFWAPTAGASISGGGPSVYGGFIWGDLRATRHNEKGEFLRLDLEAGVTEGRVMLGAGHMVVEALSATKDLEAYAASIRIGVLRPWPNSDLDANQFYWGPELAIQAVGFGRSFFGFTDFFPLGLSLGVFRPWKNTDGVTPRVAITYGL